MGLLLRWWEVAGAGLSVRTGPCPARMRTIRARPDSWPFSRRRLAFGSAEEKRHNVAIDGCERNAREKERGCGSFRTHNSGRSPTNLKRT